MRLALAILALASGQAMGGWGSWSVTNWSTREVRSNLWCALEERVNAADGVAHITNSIAAPGWWVSKSWMDAWDASLYSTLTNQYVDVTRLDGLSNSLTDPCFLTIGQAMTNIGFPQFVRMPTNTFWFPSYTNYLIRKRLVQQMSNTLAAASFIRLDAADQVHCHSRIGAVNPSYTNTSGAEAWERFEADTTNNLGGVPTKFAVMERWESTNWYASGQSLMGKASSVAATCGTNNAKTAALWLLAVEYPGIGNLGGEPAPAISRGFSAQGDGYTGSNAWASAVSQASNQDRAWTNSTTIGSTAIPSVRPSPDPSDGEAVGCGYKLFGAWLLTWTFDYP